MPQPAMSSQQPQQQKSHRVETPWLFPYTQPIADIKPANNRFPPIEHGYPAIMVFRTRFIVSPQAAKGTRP
jgi:hypothetical protein